MGSLDASSDVDIFSTFVVSCETLALRVTQKCQFWQFPLRRDCDTPKLQIGCFCMWSEFGISLALPRHPAAKRLGTILEKAKSLWPSPSKWASGCARPTRSSETYIYICIFFCLNLTKVNIYQVRNLR